MRGKVLVDFLDNRTRELKRRHTFRRNCIFRPQINVPSTDLTQQVKRNLAVLDNVRRDFLIYTVDVQMVVTFNLIQARPLAKRQRPRPRERDADSHSY